MTICSVEGCGKPVQARGWCKGHYKSMYWNHTPQAKQYQKEFRARPEILEYKKLWARKAENQPKRIEAKLVSRYGITRAEYDARLEQNEFKCEICAQPVKSQFAPRDVSRNGPDRDVVHVDHDHVTGRVRGLICGGCNNGLGYFRDSPEFLAAAIAYLEQANAGA